jgi:sarcosine oxidase subunit beta
VVRGARGTTPQTALLAEARRLFPTLWRELNFNVGLSRRGLLDLAACAAAMDDIERAADLARRLGVAAWPVPPREVRVLAPLLGADAAPHGALWQPDAGVVDGDAVVWGYARIAAARGADIVEDGAADAVVMQGGRVAGVQVGERLVRADTVVLAAATAPHLLARAGITAPLAAAPRHLLVCEPVRPLLDVVVSGDALGGTVRQSGAGAVMFETTEGGAGGWAATRTAAARLAAQFPDLRSLRVVRADTIAGLASADGAPVVGPLAVPGLWASLGWGEDEVAAAPALGLALADSIAQDRLHPLLAALAPARLAAMDALS